ncbi:MAG: AI-2E family transporter [Alphaproteobacteria bacterium]|nr:AI-2E family transporter [Alphaproteobacteria bacterium]
MSSGTADTARSRASQASGTPATGDEGTATITAGLAELRDAAVLGLFVLAVAGALYAAQPIVVPVLAAIVVGSIFAPLAARLARHGVPPPLTALAIVGLIAGGVYVLSIAMAAPIGRFLGDMPRALGQLRDKLEDLEALRRTVAELQAAIGGGTAARGADVGSGKLVEATVGVVTPALAQLVVFMGSLLFFLWSRTGIRRHIVLALPSREARLVALRVMNDIETQLATYFTTIALINVGLAVATGLGLMMLGIEGAVLWGVLAGIINFVPYVGPALVTLMLLVVGMTTQPTLLMALVPPGMFVALATIEGQLLTPAIVGRRLAMNPFLVFIGVVFWTWLWGPIGAFLAVPLLIIWMAASHHLFPPDDIDLPG